MNSVKAKTDVPGHVSLSLTSSSPCGILLLVALNPGVSQTAAALEALLVCPFAVTVCHCSQQSWRPQCHCSV